MSKKLYVSDDAPAELKELIGVSQRLVDNMYEFKTKADAGTLTLDDLDELTRRNNAITNEFPEAKEQRPDYPVRTNNMAELKALAESRRLETETLLQEQGGPVLEITSLDELKKFEKMSPDAIGDLILKAAAEKKKKEEKETNKKESPPAPYNSPEQEQKFDFIDDLFIESYEEISHLLYCSKGIHFHRHDDWSAAEISEHLLLEKINIFKGFGDDGTKRLLRILQQDEEDENLLEKPREAALILASLNRDDDRELQALLDCWDADSDLSRQLIDALKYAKHPLLSAKIATKLEAVTTEIRAGLVRVLEYREAIDEEKWTRMLENREPAVNEAILHAFVNNDLSIADNHFDTLLEDAEEKQQPSSLLTCLLAGREPAVARCHDILTNQPDKADQVPLYLACSGSTHDVGLLRHALLENTTQTSAIRALGMMGLPETVTTLTQWFPTSLKDKKEWDLCMELSETLELITGANLPLSIPDVQQGPEGKEYELAVTVDFFEEWTVWWYHNKHRFQPGKRYRRGTPFSLERCIAEMAFGKGIYWSRQYAYFELQIRSGQHVAPFFADWDVKKQMAAIKQWQRWWEANRNSFPDSQWLFHGR